MPKWLKRLVCKDVKIGYYITKGGHRAHVAFLEPDWCHGCIFIDGLTIGESWHKCGSSKDRSGDGYSLDLSTFNPRFQKPRKNP